MNHRGSGAVLVDTARNPLAWMGALVALYLGLPLLAFVVRLAVGPVRGFRTPGLLPALRVSLEGATIALALVTLFGVPLAFVLARSRGRIASVVSMIVHVPLALPPLMSGILLVYVVGPYTFLGRLFGGRLTDSLTGVVLAMAFCCAPFLIVAAKASFTALDQGLLDVATTLGHGDVSRFMRVAVPVAGPGIRAGMLLAWLRAFGEYGAVIVLAYNPATLPVYTYNQFGGIGLSTTLAPTALALVVALGVVALSRVSIPTSRPSRPPTPRPPAPTATQPIGFELDHRLGAFHLQLSHRVSAGHLAVVGPSGSGKSVLLRCLAGLNGASPGRIWFADEEVTATPVRQRRVGYVPQNFALFPHLTVWRHLLFPVNADPATASHWLDRLQLTDLADRLPSQLSGGQRQRVALAQALCNSPDVLLLDEPFSALDVPVRLELRRELRRTQRETGLATVLVTHDPEEAAFLADELEVIAEGRGLQAGPSRELFTRPASPEVARLLGTANVHRAKVLAPGLLDAGGLTLQVNDDAAAPGADVLWSVEPADVRVGTESHNGDSPVGFAATLSDVIDLGATTEYFATLDNGLELRARSRDRPVLDGGDRCRVEIPTDTIRVWSVEIRQD